MVSWSPSLIKFWPGWGSKDKGITFGGNLLSTRLGNALTFTLLSKVYVFWAFLHVIITISYHKMFVRQNTKRFKLCPKWYCIWPRNGPGESPLSKVVTKKDEDRRVSNFEYGNQHYTNDMKRCFSGYIHIFTRFEIK